MSWSPGMAVNLNSFIYRSSVITIDEGMFISLFIRPTFISSLQLSLVSKYFGVLAAWYLCFGKDRETDYTRILYCWGCQVILYILYYCFKVIMIVCNGDFSSNWSTVRASWDCLGVGHSIGCTLLLGPYCIHLCSVCELRAIGPWLWTVFYQI